MSDMTDLSALKVDRIFYLELTVRTLDHAAVADLTAHGSVEWSLRGDNACFLTVCHRVCDLILALFISGKSYEGCHLGLILKLVISCESGC